ncbi:MAG: VanZ family protein [Flavobacterium sp.]
MLKKICLGAAFVWAAIILYLCLIRMSEFPAITIPYLDKAVHAFFYFVFTILWFYALRFYYNKQSRTKLLGIVFLLALIFGATVELFQNYFTVYRSGDVTDVLANASGSIIAILIITTLDKKDFLSKISK